MRDASCAMWEENKDGNGNWVAGDHGEVFFGFCIKDAEEPCGTRNISLTQRD